jgi:DNA-binding MarR family transcriptional regulator
VEVLNNRKYHELALKVSLLSGMTLKLKKQDFEKRLQKKKIDINPPALIVLRLVRSRMGTISEVSKQMILAPATIVPIIDLLEKKGLVTRGPDASDRRKNILSITSKGLLILDAVPIISNEDLIVKSLLKMGEQKSEQLVARLEELLKNISGGEEASFIIGKLVEKENGISRNDGKR